MTCFQMHYTNNIYVLLNRSVSLATGSCRRDILSAKTLSSPRTWTAFKRKLNTADSQKIRLRYFISERKDRLEKGGGGVACYVAETIPYERLHDLEEDGREVIWLKNKLKKLPRKYSCNMLACIYHPPGAENWSMREYMINSLDTILRGSPDCGVILSGNFNQFKDTFYVHIMVTSSLLRLQHVV